MMTIFIITLLWKIIKTITPNVFMWIQQFSVLDPVHFSDCPALKCTAAVF